MLQDARIAVVVLRRDDHKPIGTLAGFRECRVFDLLARIVDRKVEITNVNQLGFDAVALVRLFKDKSGDVLAGAASAHRTENYWNEEWSGVHRFRVNCKNA